MSLMKSLARVAAGVMLAKGIGTIMKNAQGRPQQSGGSTGGQGSGGLLGELFGNNTAQTGARRAGAGAGSGGLGDILGQVLGGRSGGGTAYGGPNSPTRTGSAQGGLGGIFDQLGGGGGLGGMAAGGLGGILGGLLGGGSQAAQAQDTQAQGGLAQGGLAHKGAQPANDSSFGDLFNEALATGDEPETAPTPEQNALAGLMLKAMIQAAKSDGDIDEHEKTKLMAEFGELDDDERAFIREQMAAPVDAAALAREVPQGFGPQVYLMSLMAIEFDNRKEAEYLHQLAQGLGLDKQAVNAIHQKVGAINLYA